MDSSDWSNEIRYHIFDTKPDTEFKWHSELSARPNARARHVINWHPLTWRSTSARPIAGARHVSRMASYDVASNIWQALARGHRRPGGRESHVLQDALEQHEPDSGRGGS